MITQSSTLLVKVAPADSPKYYAIFQQFEHFTNYINFAIEFFSPEIWVDEEAQPTLACFYTAPAYFLWGDPDTKDVSSLFAMIHPDSWLIPSSEKWDRHLVAYFGKNLVTHPRTSFEASSLSLEFLRSLKTDLPAGLRLVPINERHVNDREGMLYQDLLSKFFSAADFFQQGAGFCLLEDEKIIGFAAANYPIRNNILEVYIRVDYNDDPCHRQKGLGTQLSVALLEYCLENGLEPQWDAANEVSVRLALKLGYSLRSHWKMYHLL
jgi:GNAT superfamily N-acetyltransferase